MARKFSQVRRARECSYYWLLGSVSFGFIRRGSVNGKRHGETLEILAMFQTEKKMCCCLVLTHSSPSTSTWSNIRVCVLLIFWLIQLCSIFCWICLCALNTVFISSCHSTFFIALPFFLLHNFKLLVYPFPVSYLFFQ